jgi:excisionase family DNA binding protein
VNSDLVVMLTRDDLEELITCAVQKALAAQEPDRWLCTREAADYLGLSPDTLRRRAAEGRITAEQDTDGGKLWFRLSELRGYREGR